MKARLRSAPISCFVSSSISSLFFFFVWGCHVCTTSEIFLYCTLPCILLLCLAKPGTCFSPGPAKRDIHLLPSTLALRYQYYLPWMASTWVMEFWTQVLRFVQQMFCPLVPPPHLPATASSVEITRILTCGFINIFSVSLVLKPTAITSATTIW